MGLIRFASDVSRGLRSVLCIACFLLSAPCSAQNTVIELWPDRQLDPAAEPETMSYERPVPILNNVSNARIEVYLPDAALATGASVIVAPGGGYSILAIEHEGTKVIEWLNGIGVAGILLYYRVPQQDQGNRYSEPLADGQEAVRLVREHAGEWGIDPERIGMLGFSAGGHLTISVGTKFERATRTNRPDFLIPIYPAYLLDGDGLASDIVVDGETPPTILIHADDDRWDSTSARGSALFYAALNRAAVPSAIHVYAAGGHGFGINPTGGAVDAWPGVVEEWMRAQGFLGEGGKDH